MGIRPDIGFTGIPAPSEGLGGAILGGITGFLTGGPGGAAVGAVTGWFAGEGESPTSPGVAGGTGYGAAPLATGCPTGYVWRNGQCEKEGIVGWGQRTIPGGATGVAPYQPGYVAGYGVPGSSPQARQQTTLRCLPGMVLGRDNLCYPKRMLRPSDRKHPPGTKPLLTGGEMKTLRKIGSLQKKVQKAWTTAGKPGNRPAPKKKFAPAPHHHHPKA